MKTLVLIPAFNAAATLPSIIPAIRRYCQDILVIDDGSTDRTSSAAEKLDCLLIRFEHNRGKGAALKAGFAYAIQNEFDAVLTIDSDGQHDSGDIPKFIRIFGESGADLIIGSRSGDRGEMPWDRRFSNWITSRFLSILLGRKIEDSQCGYRLISTRLLRSITLTSDRFELESEIIIKAARSGYKIDFLPIKGIYNRKSRSQMRRLTDSLRWCRMIIKSL